MKHALLVLTALLVVTAPTLPAQALAEDEVQMKRWHRDAVELFQENRYADALQRFQQVLAVLEKYGWTGAGASHEYAGRCYRHLGQQANALKSYERARRAYEEEGNHTEATRIGRILRVLSRDRQRDLRATLQNWDSWVWLSVLKYSSSYGTEPIRLLRTMGVIILLFSALYFPYSVRRGGGLCTFQGLVIKAGVRGAIWNLKEAIVTSTNVFIGRGHAAPADTTTQLVLLLESLLGYLMMALIVAMLVAQILE